MAVVGCEGSAGVEVWSGEEGKGPGSDTGSPGAGVRSHVGEGGTAGGTAWGTEALAGWKGHLWGWAAVRGERLHTNEGDSGDKPMYWGQGEPGFSVSGRGGPAVERRRERWNWGYQCEFLVFKIYVYLWMCAWMYIILSSGNRELPIIVSTPGTQIAISFFFFPRVCVF